MLARAASGTIDTSAELELEAVDGVDTGDDKESDGVWAEVDWAGPGPGSGVPHADAARTTRAVKAAVRMFRRSKSASPWQAG